MPEGSYPVFVTNADYESVRTLSQRASSSRLHFLLCVREKIRY